MTQNTIYRTEPMATRALAAEIRHDHRRFVSFLEDVSGKSLGTFREVLCEVKYPVGAASQSTVRIDVQLNFEDNIVGIEAKLDHELTREQVRDQIKALGGDATIFVLVPSKDFLPAWLSEFPGVSIIGWEDALACFNGSRLTMEDIHGEGRLLKTTVEAWLAALEVGERLPGWSVDIRRGGSGMPSIEIQSPALACGRTIRGQLEVAGRGMPESLDAVRFISHVGIAVPENGDNYFDPDTSDVIPGWVEHLRVLQRDVLQGEEEQLLVSFHAPGNSNRKLGKWKNALAKRYLGEHLHLAKGYTDGWAIGPKTTTVPRDQLGRLAEVTVEIFARWYKAETV
ncbi:hypothetical protein [Arthrobacter zhaoxinii]|uniref:hypothetical protein n=1 Tax=Arthrobacter zhaoxinii TaxID=2964616 RepID=UPI002107E317|nr:hypothetical protein [Arthrobacter zhaoxinii]MCQ1999623.1 hypothetical protein [Arthrobacter zhaoxinii]